MYVMELSEQRSEQRTVRTFLNSSLNSGRFTDGLDAEK